MDYISIKYLQTFLGYTSPQMLFKEKLIQDLEAQFQSKAVFQQENKHFDLTQVLVFVSTLKNEEQIVFDQWILESKGLKSLLLEDKLLLNDCNPKLTEHFMFKSFCAFISPLILPLLTQNVQQKELVVCSYLSILNHDSRLIIQTKISAQINERWKEYQNNYATTKISDFNQAVKLIFNDEQIQIVNYLKKEFYSTKVQYIENALHLIQHPQASYSFVLWLCKQLNKLELNPEHLDKVKEVTQSIHKNDGLYFKEKHKQTKSVNRLFFFFLFPLALILTLFFVFFNPLTEKTKVSEQESAFSHFSKKERQQMDSLIRIMEKNKGDQINDPNQQTTYLHLTPIGLDLITRDTLENAQVQNYVQACQKAYDLLESGKMDKCSPYTEKQFNNISNKPFLDLNQLKGEQELFIENKSKYQVQVLVFDSIQNGKVYSKFLQVGETVSLKTNIGQKVIFIPGNNLSKANFAKNLDISEMYQHHFCFMDGNFISHLFTNYTIQDISEKEIKIQLNDDEDLGFYLLDIYQGLIN